MYPSIRRSLAWLLIAAGALAFSAVGADARGGHGGGGMGGFTGIVGSYQGGGLSGFHAGSGLQGGGFQAISPRHINTPSVGGFGMSHPGACAPYSSTAGAIC
jgi:hypothetical protein